jgi:aryl-alcohol dehydrogenase-like predicted oxidoreductase
MAQIPMNDQGNTKHHILDACEQSLQRLQTDYMEQFESLLPTLEIELNEDDLQFCDTFVAPGAHVTSYFNPSLWMK